MPTEIVGVVFALGVAACFATGTVLARVGLMHTPAGTGSLLGLAGGSVVAFAIALGLSPDSLFHLSPTAYLWLLLTGALNFPFARFLNFVSVKLLGVARSSAVMSTSPLFSAVFAISFLGERLTLPLVVGTLTTVTGIALVVSADWRGEQAGETATVSGQGRTALGRLQTRMTTPLVLGYGAALSAALAYGVIPVIGKKLVTGVAEPAATAAYTLLFGTLVFALAIGARVPRDLRVTPQRALFMVILGGTVMSQGVMLLYFALRYAPAVVVSPIISLNPLLAILLVHLFLQRMERITPRIVLGAALVVAGVIIITVGAGR